MFDFSFGEILIVGLVALIVLGPERLPKAARFVGLWVRRARAQWYSVKSELERELATEEMRRSLADGQQVMREAEAQLRATDANIRSAVSDTAAEVRAPGADVPAVETDIVETDVETDVDAVAEETPADVIGDFDAETTKRDAHGQ